eukprot:659431-Pelagomonas_calceolata.AAC.1
MAVNSPVSMKELVMGMPTWGGPEKKRTIKANSGAWRPGPLPAGDELSMSTVSFQYNNSKNFLIDNFARGVIPGG